MLKERFVTNPLWLTFLDIYFILFKGSIRFTVNWISPKNAWKPIAAGSGTIMIEWGQLKPTIMRGHYSLLHLPFKPDCLAVPKALVPKISDKQLFDCTTFVWKSWLYMIMSCTYFWAKALPILILLMSPIWQSSSSIGTTFNVFSYDAVWTENRTHHLLDDERMRYGLRQSYLRSLACLCQFNYLRVTCGSPLRGAGSNWRKEYLSPSSNSIIAAFKCKNMKLVHTIKNTP